VAKIPSVITAASQGYKTVEFKGYKFYLPKLYVKKKGKESVYVNVETKEKFMVQLSDYMPVDDLCKMPDHRRDL